MTKKDKREWTIIWGLALLVVGLSYWGGFINGRVSGYIDGLIDGFVIGVNDDLKDSEEP